MPKSAAEKLIERGRRNAFEHAMDDDEYERKRNREDQQRRKREIEKQREEKEKRKSSGKASIMLGRRG